MSDRNVESGGTFESVDWSEASSRGIVARFGRPTASALVLGLMLGGIAYNYLLAKRDVVVLLGREIPLLDWMYWFALLFVVVQVVVPAVNDPERTRAVWNRFSENRIAVACGAYLVLLFAVGTVGPYLIERPTVTPAHSYQPPVGFTVSESAIVDCLGPVEDGRCHGTLAYPLGTDFGGKDVAAIAVHGLNTSLQVGTIAAVLVVTFGTLVGTVAATAGGAVDELSMRFVDVLQSVPAFFVYVLLVATFVRDFELMILVFGLLSWGGTARLVRSEALGHLDREYVRAARSAGAGRAYVIRRHLLPNVSNTVVTAATLLVPMFVLFEAALSYLDLAESDPRIVSLGTELGSALSRPFADLFAVWWVTAVPAFVLVSFVLAINVFGDQLRDAFDPRMS